MTDTNRSLVFKTWKAKTLAIIGAVLAAITLPEIVHAIGLSSGLGSSLGETLLPMHLAIFALGFTAGPIAGVLGGILSPIISFAITGMPSAAVLPFMVIELAGYGLVAGLTAKTRMPNFVKLLIAQISGRAMRAAAVLIAFYGFGAGLPVASIWNGVINGLPGILVQWLVLPLFLYALERKTKNNE